jgi:beta-phosphoglucomutase-like phosphatase (HAD superfamily)
MHAAIFDIDGTLLDSYGIDNSMYADAVRSALGTVVIRDAWEKYARVTDTGVLADICSDNALVYDGSVSTAVMNVYLGFLRSHMEAKGPYQEIPGALQYLNTLRKRPDVRVAYATGGWRATAEHKLTSAGFPLEGSLWRALMTTKIARRSCCMHSANWRGRLPRLRTLATGCGIGQLRSS